MARNERFSFQVVMRSEGPPVGGIGDLQTVRVAVSGPEGWAIRVRRVEYVPVRHHNLPVDVPVEDMDGVSEIPGYVPDPLFDEDTVLLPPRETHAFWITVQVPEDASPGERQLEVTVFPQEQEGTAQALPPLTHSVSVTVHDVVLAPREGFHITHWFYTDALMDYYGTKGFDRAFWAILPKYLQNIVDHGLDTLYVPVFTPPLDGVKRPSQLLRVSRIGSDTYRFDWRDVRRYIELAREAGITHFEWCHLFTQWGAKQAIRVYEGQGQDEKLLWPASTRATAPTYRTFLSQFLPAFYNFLTEQGLLDHSFFHVSDEPHGEEDLAQYRAARNLLDRLAPWMSVMDALSDIEYARQGLVNMPVPSIRTALQFVEEGIPCWCYYCCSPRGEYLNRLLDTPLPKIAMHGLLFYRWPLQGFLHWGYNYWYRSQTRELIDPYAVQDGHRWARGWAYGDPFVVYPGVDGPVDSIRWEVFAESLQDYRLLQTLGISRDDERLAPLRSFSEFPKSEEWRRELRKGLLGEASK
ncbi:MAG: DUF4091 domain-containing protein [Chloroflexi bacterium]|nr:DUF4091 domain-containing protein [Chloroflexota bacterium]